jgi:cephalosporin hydroxylase
MDIDKIVAESKASQNKIELNKLLQYVSEIQVDVVLEIGVHKGYSLQVWHDAFQPELLIGIDNDLHEFDHEHVTKELILLDSDSHQMETKEQVCLHLGKKQIDFMFLDGDHTYEGVKRDYELYSPLVRKGGIIALHDIALDGPTWRTAGVDVQRFWNELIGSSGKKYLFFWDEIGKGTGTGLYYI